MSLTINERRPFARSTPVLTNSNMGRRRQNHDVSQEDRARPKPGVRIHLIHAPFGATVSGFSGGEVVGSMPPRRVSRPQTLVARIQSNTPFGQPDDNFVRDLDEPKVSVSNLWLQDSLAELEQIDQEAKEEGYPHSNKVSRQNAKYIITQLAKGSYPSPAIYPTADGEIAILFQERAAKASVLILCDHDGGAACFSTISGKRRRARYDDASDLPDAFVRGELLKFRFGTPRP